jgi:hypothetical protein
MNRVAAGQGKLTEEMLHLALVQNLLSAIGAAPHLGRPNLPAPAHHYPAGVNLTLVPFASWRATRSTRCCSTSCTSAGRRCPATSAREERSNSSRP